MSENERYGDGICTHNPLRKEVAKRAKGARRTFFLGLSNDGTVAYFLPADSVSETHAKELKNVGKPNLNSGEQAQYHFIRLMQRVAQKGGHDMKRLRRRVTCRLATRKDIFGNVVLEKDENLRNHTKRNEEVVHAKEDEAVRTQDHDTSKKRMYCFKNGRPFVSKHELCVHINTAHRNPGQFHENGNVIEKQTRSHVCDFCDKRFGQKSTCFARLQEYD